MQSSITREMLIKAKPAERCQMMINIIKGKAKYIEDSFDGQTDFD
jgi:hypothetical protein